MRAIAMLLAMTGAAWAQDNRATDFQVNRLKDRLGLSDEQAEKVRAIYAKDAEERQKLEEGRSAKIAELLDENQKKQYEEMRGQRQAFRGFGGQGAPGGGNFQFGGGNRTMGAMQMDQLKQELTLSDEQAAKIQPLLDEFNAPLEKRAAELREQGPAALMGMDWQGELKKYTDSLDRLVVKVKEHLDETQKGKLDGLVERVTSFTRMLPNLMERFGNRGGGDRGGRPDVPSVASGPSAEERIDRAVAALKIENADERAALAGLIGKVVRAQVALEEVQKTSQKELSEAAKNGELSDAAVDDRIQQALEQRRKMEKELISLQKQLVEVVTNRQELELLVQGVLK